MPLGDRRENPYAACTVLEGEDGRSYQLASYRHSGGCTIVEVDGHLGIFGDLCPLDNRGVWSLRGYDLDWYVGTTMEEHLASKFLRSGWFEDIAERQLRTLLDDVTAFPRAPVDAAVLKAMVGARVWRDGESRFLEQCARAGLDVSGDVPGYGYNTHDVVLLAGLREKIACFRHDKANPKSRPPPAPVRGRGPTNLGQHMRPGLRRS